MNQDQSRVLVNAKVHPYREGGYGLPSGTEESKKTDDNFDRSPRSATGVGWLPPGTKQEDTWRAGDRAVGVA